VLLSQINEFFRDRIQVNSILIVLCFVSVLLLSSQSAASYPTYLLALAMLLSLRQWRDVVDVPMGSLILLLLVYLTASSMWSDGFALRQAVSVFTRALLVFLFVVAFAECQVRGMVQRWFGKALVMVGSGAVFAALVVFFVTEPEDGRLNGLGQLDTHVIAALIFGVVMIFALELLFREPSRFWRAAAIVCMLLIALAVGLSGSRNAWVSVLAGLFTFVCAHTIVDRRRFLRVVCTAGVLLAAALSIMLMNDDARAFLMPRGSSFRPEIWSHFLLEVWNNGPVFGRGILTLDDVQAGGVVFPHAHNMYLSVLFQSGVLGLVLFVALVAMVLKTLYEHYAVDDAKLALGILAIALPSYLLDGHEIVDKVGETWFLFWLPVAISLALRWRPHQ
jgi:O-antigen ligase